YRHVSRAERRGRTITRRAGDGEKAVFYNNLFKQLEVHQSSAKSIIHNWKTLKMSANFPKCGHLTKFTISGHFLVKHHQRKSKNPGAPYRNLHA
uniref:Uncharacterized protein n=1 Tax=Poecilia reticulata TaxID=8081 RepID=A0A3P9N6M2_POERE